MNYYIADTHFGHYNIIKLDERPFETAEEMDRKLIENWNNKVTEKDDIWIVGDFAFRNGNPIDYYAKLLKGHKHLIMGNHDKLNNEAKHCFDSIDNGIRQIQDKNERIVLCHYPLAEWNGYYRGAYHIYAHIHNNLNPVYHYMKTMDKALNAGCMINNYEPVTLEELISNNEKFKKDN